MKQVASGLSITSVTAENRKGKDRTKAIEAGKQAGWRQAPQPAVEKRGRGGRGGEGASEQREAEGS
jgi:hypothetical protein